MFKKIEDIAQKSLLPGFKGRFIHTHGFTQAFWEIEQGAELPEHSHFHEQTTQVTEGILEFTLNGETRLLESGSIVVIPANAVHSGKALTNCKVTDVFCPVREDYQ